MKVLIVEPHKHPRMADIPHTLDAMQEIVGGTIQAIYPWEDEVAVVCDDEGMMKGCELNRHIAPGVAIAGTFFLCAIGGDDFADLPDDLANKYRKMLYHPQTFARTADGSIAAIRADGKITRVW